MSKFIYRLESLLNVKKQLEENTKNELGKAIQRFEQEKKYMEELVSKKDSCIEDLNNKAVEGISISVIKDFNNYILALKKRIEFQEKIINESEKNVDIIRVKLIKVVQERKMLEKLKERDLEIYTKEELTIEQKTNDEISSYRYLKQMKDKR